MPAEKNWKQIILQYNYCNFILTSPIINFRICSNNDNSENYAIRMRCNNTSMSLERVFLYSLLP